LPFTLILHYASRRRRWLSLFYAFFAFAIGTYATLRCYAIRHAYAITFMILIFFAALFLRHCRFSIIAILFSCFIFFHYLFISLFIFFDYFID